MYMISVVAYVAAVIWFILNFVKMGISSGSHRAVRQRRFTLTSFFSVIVIGILCAIMNPWFWLYLPLTFIVLGIGAFVLIAVDEKNRWGK